MSGGPSGIFAVIGHICWSGSSHGLPPPLTMIWMISGLHWNTGRYPHLHLQTRVDIVHLETGTEMPCPGLCVLSFSIGDCCRLQWRDVDFNVPFGIIPPHRPLLRKTRKTRKSNPQNPKHQRVDIERNKIALEDLLAIQKDVCLV